MRSAVSPRTDSNRLPSAYEALALPGELRRQKAERSARLRAYVQPTVPRHCAETARPRSVQTPIGPDSPGRFCGRFRLLPGAVGTLPNGDRALLVASFRVIGIWVRRPFVRAVPLASLHRFSRPRAVVRARLVPALSRRRAPARRRPQFPAFGFSKNGASFIRRTRPAPRSGTKQNGNAVLFSCQVLGTNFFHFPEYRSRRRKKEATAKRRAGRPGSSSSREASAWRRAATRRRGRTSGRRANSGK